MGTNISYPSALPSLDEGGILSENDTSLSYPVNTNIQKNGVLVSDDYTALDIWSATEENQNYVVDLNGTIYKKNGTAIDAKDPSSVNFVTAIPIVESPSASILITEEQYKKNGTAILNGAKQIDFIGRKLVYDIGTGDLILNMTGDGFFGDGSDGDATISIDTTLTRDMFYDNLTINAGVTLWTGNYRLFVRGVLTNNGTIDNSAILNVATPAGYFPLFGSGTAGGAGGICQVPSPTPGGPGLDASAQLNSAFNVSSGTGGTGGGGGAGSGGSGYDPTAGGNGGVAASSTKISGESFIKRFDFVVGSFMKVDASFSRIYGHASSTGGGGGGAGGDIFALNYGGTGGAGGAGGGNGGYLFVAAGLIIGSGTIQSNGGNGGTGSNGSGGTHVSGPVYTGGGGGGGGGAAGNGGVVVAMHRYISSTITLQANAGSPGAGGVGGSVTVGGLPVGTGSDGSAGGTGTAGVVYNIRLT